MIPMTTVAGEHLVHRAQVVGRVDDERPHPDRAPARYSVETVTISAIAAESRSPVNANGATCGSATVARVRDPAGAERPGRVQQHRVDVVERVDDVEQDRPDRGVEREQ